MKKIFILLFVTSLCIIGCRSDEDTIYDYVGTWSGTYDGNDEGVWNIVIAMDGKVTGTMHSDVSQENYTISGRLNNSGGLTATLGLPDRGGFTGLLTKDRKADGNWSNLHLTPSGSGSWTGEKQ